jgi:Fic family protein
MSFFIHQLSDWPRFTFDSDALISKLSTVRNMQGRLFGKLNSLGFEIQQEAFLETLTLDVLKSTEIEGEFLQPEQVRSSIARQLGMDIAGLIPSDRDVDGVVEMMLDATRNFQEKLDNERLWGWQSSLFPSGRSGMYKINIGQWRNDEKGPMQVVSGSIGKEKIHFQAPNAEILPIEMTNFLHWFNENQDIDAVLKAGIAHLWFISIHPFEDGNGRIARALTDMQLSKSENSSQRFYSMSAQIRLLRNEYYAILEETQRGNLNITQWLFWFLECMQNALQSAEITLEKTLKKAVFWKKHAKNILNERQITILNKLLSNFEGKLTSSKWAKIAKCSQDTATRDIQDLIMKGILKKDIAEGRSTNYLL